MRYFVLIFKCIYKLFGKIWPSENRVVGKFGVGKSVSENLLSKKFPVTKIVIKMIKK